MWRSEALNKMAKYFANLANTGLTPELDETLNDDQRDVLTRNVKISVNFIKGGSLLYVKCGEFPLFEEVELPILRGIMGESAQVIHLDVSGEAKGKEIEAVRQKIMKYPVCAVRMPGLGETTELLEFRDSAWSTLPALPGLQILVPLWFGMRGGGGDDYYRFKGFHLYSMDQISLVGGSLVPDREYVWPPPLKVKL